MSTKVSVSFSFHRSAARTVSLKPNRTLQWDEVSIGSKWTRHS